MAVFAKPMIFADGQNHGATLTNFWEQEPGFVWSKGKWCEIQFPFDTMNKKVGLVDLLIDVDVYSPPDFEKGQNLFVYLNGLRVGTFHCARRTVFVATVDGSVLKATDNIIVIDTPDALSPSSAGLEDTRVLGLKLFSVEFTKGA